MTEISLSQTSGVTLQTGDLMPVVRDGQWVNTDGGAIVEALSSATSAVEEITSGGFVTETALEAELGGYVTKESAAAIGTRPVVAITASGQTAIPIPSAGDIIYIVTATADATLQFSGTVASDVGQIIEILVRKTPFTVTFPTTNVEVDTGAPPPTTASSTNDTPVRYLAISGVSYIEGGV